MVKCLWQSVQFFHKQSVEKGQLRVCFSHRREVMEAPLPYENCFSAGAESCGCSKWCQNPSKAANSIYPPH